MEWMTRTHELRNMPSCSPLASRGVSETVRASFSIDLQAFITNEFGKHKDRRR
ncbi:hypothetical protein SESBI_21792 [Sesbania bispinosa]|nr:hypothetical protein SESBI_21792 [Sesbania bispinosa]